jgi:hypothetical protein
MGETLPRHDPEAGQAGGLPNLLDKEETQEMTTLRALSLALSTHVPDDTGQRHYGLRTALDNLASGISSLDEQLQELAAERTLLKGLLVTGPVGDDAAANEVRVLRRKVALAHQFRGDVLAAAAGLLASFAQNPD